MYVIVFCLCYTFSGGRFPISWDGELRHHPVFVFAFAFSSHTTASMAACGRVLISVYLVLALAFSFILNLFVSLCPRDTLAVRGRFLPVVYLVITPFSSRSPRHAGGTREVFDGGLPHYGVLCLVQIVLFVFFLAR